MKKDTISNAQAAKWHEIMETGDVLVANKPVPFNVPQAKQTLITAESQTQKSPSRILADNATSVEALREALMNFDGCRLKLTAKNTVFSDGKFGSDIMMIGEAPGATEDEQGIPFCGESGKLLDNVLKSIGLCRKKNFYISNTIFWRPPANRRPTDEEIEICKPFIEKHIALAKPKLLILVGATAVSALLGKHLQISKIRQEYYEYKNPYLEDTIITTALFHPAYLLRQPYQKRAMWYDLLKIQQFIKNL